MLLEKRSALPLSLGRVCFGVSLVSLGSIAFEVALTRYFSVASWAEYGYWVISIAMAGLALSGVVLALFRGGFVSNFRTLFILLPLALVVLMTVGFHGATLIPFNPIELQNPFLWKRQLGYVALYYLALSPFFFCTGLFLGMCFTALRRHITTLYAADLVGAGIGSLLMLAAMVMVHPFYLVAVVAIGLGAVPLMNVFIARGRARWTLAAFSLFFLGVSEASLVGWNHARMFEYKDAYGLLKIPENKIRATMQSPRGYDLVLDNYTERRDLPLTNNLSMLGADPPPRAYGLYRDGNRLTSLIATEFATDFSYVQGALSTLPYLMRPAKKSLLIGTDGGFRLAEVQTLDAGEVVAIESDKSVRMCLINQRLPEQLAKGNHKLQLVSDSPQSFLARTNGNYDLIDTGDDYLQCGYGGVFAFTVEGIQLQLDRLSQDGMLSLPVEISEFPEYAVRVILSSVEAVRGRKIKDPFRHLMVLRSEWTARVLVCKSPFHSSDIDLAKKFCRERSFDLSYYPGITAETAQEVVVWNELPHFVLDLEEAEPDRGTAPDAIRDHMFALVNGDRSEIPCEGSFALTAVTNSRPFLNYVIRPSAILRTLKRLDYLPQGEIGLLINYAVFVQAIFIAAFVAAIPFARFSKGPLRAASVGKTTAYFAAIGLGYLLVEVMLIERFAPVFQDSVTAFSVVLCSLLIWSGIGSWLVGRLRMPQKRCVLLTAAALVLAGVFLTILWNPTLVLLGMLPLPVRCTLLALALGPLGIAMGMPFSAAMANLCGPLERLVPMAWGVNGAFSVVAPPFARLLAVYAGFNVVLWVALALYLVAWLSSPRVDLQSNLEGVCS